MKTDYKEIFKKEYGIEMSQHVHNYLKLEYSSSINASEADILSLLLGYEKERLLTKRKNTCSSDRESIDDEMSATEALLNKMSYLSEKTTRIEPESEYKVAKNDRLKRFESLAVLLVNACKTISLSESPRSCIAAHFNKKNLFNIENHAVSLTKLGEKKAAALRAINRI